MIEVRRHVKDNFRRGKIRVFVSGEDKPDLPVPSFGSVRGDGSDEDQAWKRYNREEIRLQREVIAEAIAEDPELGEQLGKLVFSRKAGCGCGCSPGFIAQGISSQDVWIERKIDDPNERWLSAGS